MDEWSLQRFYKRFSIYEELSEQGVIFLFSRLYDILIMLHGKSNSLLLSMGARKQYWKEVLQDAPTLTLPGSSSS